MPDLLGLDQQQAQQDTTTDYLGAKVPVSFKNQPALPTGIGGPTAASTSAAPPTIAGAGTAAPSGPTGPGFDQLAGAAIPGMELGGGGATGAGSGEGGTSGPAVGGQLGELPSAETQAGPINFSANPFGASATVGRGGPGVTLSPTGALGITTGNKTLDTAAGTVAKTLGVPLSESVIHAINQLAQSPVLGIIGSAFGAAALPFGLVTLAHNIAQGMPTSVENMQAALQQVNPEFHLTPAQAQQIEQWGASAFAGPTVGGPQPIGMLPIDTPVTNVAGTTAAGPASGSGQNLSLAESLSPTPTFAALANAFGFGREDVGGPPGAPPSPPDAPAPGDTTTGGPGEA